MPWTLYRYILTELVKLLVLSAAVLVTLMAFAVAIKPLADGLLGPGTLVKFVAYTIPTVLGFALPFAGAFAATLVFIRLAGENEVLACAASGISYRGILVPVLVLGMALTGGLFFLSNFVVPGFYKRAARTVRADLVSVLVHQLDQHKPFDKIDGVVIYADSATETNDLPTIGGAAVQPSRLVQLGGLAVARVGERHRIQSVTLAQKANLLLFHDPSGRGSWMRIYLHNGSHYDQDRGTLVTVKDGWSRRVPLDRGLGDNPKYLSYFELRDLGRHPAKYDDVHKRMTALANALAVRKLKVLIQRGMAAGASPGAGRVELVGRRDRDRYTLGVPSVKPVAGGLELQSGGENRPVRVSYRRGGKLVQRMEAASGRLRILPSDRGGAPSIAIRLRHVAAYDARHPGPATRRDTQRLARMYWPKAVFAQEAGARGRPRDLSLDQLSELAGLKPYRDAPPVRRAVEQVLESMHRLDRRILAQLHERAASAVACCLLLLLGAVLSIRLKGQMTLVVYFWSFLLAIMSLILTSTGKHMTTGSQGYALPVTLGVLWSGNAILAAVTAGVYALVARN